MTKLKQVRVTWNEWSDYSAVISITQEQYDTMDKDELLLLALDAEPITGSNGGVIEGDEILVEEEE